MQIVSNTMFPSSPSKQVASSYAMSSNAQMPAIAEEAAEENQTALPCAYDQGGCSEHCEECYERTKFCVCATLTDVSGFAQKKKKQEHVAKEERKTARAEAWKSWEHKELYVLTADSLASDRGASDDHAQAKGNLRARSSSIAHRRTRCWE